MVCWIVLMRLFQLLAAACGGLQRLSRVCPPAERLRVASPIAVASALSFLLRACLKLTQNAI